MCHCAKASGGSPSGRRSWSGATPTRTSSSGRGARSNSWRTRLGRVIRDIRRKIAGNPRLTERFADLLLALAVRVRYQDHRQRGPKVYALHAPEVECIGKGKARAPYEFGCKVSIATPATKPRGGQFVLHAKALVGNPFDGHTLGPVVSELEQLTGVETRRIHVDKGYRGHNHQQKFRVWTPPRSSRYRRLKAEHRMGRNHLKSRDGDRANAILAAAGYNSPSSCAGSGGFCAPSSRRSNHRRFASDIPKNYRSIVLHGRLSSQRVRLSGRSSMPQPHKVRNLKSDPAGSGLTSPLLLAKNRCFERFRRVPFRCVSVTPPNRSSSCVCDW